MSHQRMASLPIVILALAIGAVHATAQASGTGSDLKDGIDQFRNGQYDKAILLFHNVILDPTAGSQKAAAYFLIAKSYMAVGKLDDADRNLEFYLTTYPGAPDYEEAVYQNGRLLFLQQEYENAIQVLQGFITSYPRSQFVSSAWFWAAESLYALGRWDDAEGFYQKIITDYPTSVKVEAAQYKISLIQLRRQQAEMAKLLTWSHEELLRNVQEYQNREKAYVQAIEAYQKRLAASSSEDDRKVIADLQQQLAQKTDQIAQLKAATAAGTGAAATAAAAVPAAPAAPATGPSAADIDRTQRLLAAKQAALVLKEQYLQWLISNEGSGK